MRIPSRLLSRVQFFNLKNDFTVSDLKLSYLKKVKKCHPDLSSSKDAHEEFLKIQNDYTELLDFLKNEKYSNKTYNQYSRNSNNTTSSSSSSYPTSNQKYDTYQNHWKRHEQRKYYSYINNTNNYSVISFALFTAIMLSFMFRRNDQRRHYDEGRFPGHVGDGLNYLNVSDLDEKFKNNEIKSSKLKRYENNTTHKLAVNNHAQERAVKATIAHMEAQRGLLKESLHPWWKPYVNFKDKEGRTPLHYAVIANKPQSVEALLEHGSRHDVVDHHGWTAYDYAREFDHPQCGNLLFRMHEYINRNSQLRDRIGPLFKVHPPPVNDSNPRGSPNGGSQVVSFPKHSIIHSEGSSNHPGGEGSSNHPGEEGSSNHPGDDRLPNPSDIPKKPPTYYFPPRTVSSPPRTVNRNNDQQISHISPPQHPSTPPIINRS
eukprot:GHVL01041728.1.p1 GENE.GHVL01041728.1~~GHVL01041728.1.p1  ORF type:complete len:430 (+),score=99.42 GHVL01041728.1:44-1333(+)